MSELMAAEGLPEKKLSDVRAEWEVRLRVRERESPNRCPLVYCSLSLSLSLSRLSLIMILSQEEVGHVAGDQRDVREDPALKNSGSEVRGDSMGADQKERKTTHADSASCCRP